MIDEDQYLRIGIIFGVHGLNGRLKILVVSHNTNRFQIDNYVYLKEKTGYNKYKVKEFIHKKNKTYLLRLEGIHDRITSMSFKGIEVYITKTEAERTRNELQENTYYYYDITGCSVYLDGKKFGEVTDIIEAGGGETLVITNDKGKKFLIPFVESMVDTKDIFNKKIDIYPVEGLFDI